MRLINASSPGNPRHMAPDKENPNGVTSRLLVFIVNQQVGLTGAATLLPDLTLLDAYSKIIQQDRAFPHNFKDERCR